ncbi:Uncharacterised protein [Serratia entomophila]|nr:Uncharacterised protein [Serratia entomophila]
MPQHGPFFLSHQLTPVIFFLSLPHDPFHDDRRPEPPFSHNFVLLRFSHRAPFKNAGRHGNFFRGVPAFHKPPARQAVDLSGFRAQRRTSHGALAMCILA